MRRHRRWLAAGSAVPWKCSGWRAWFSALSVGMAALVIGGLPAGASAQSWAWSAQTSGTTNEIGSVSCATVSSCEAVGQGTLILGTTNGGQMWTTQNLTVMGWFLYGVSCATTNMCETVGANGTILGTTNGGLSWSSQSSGTTNTLFAASCASTQDCELVGEGPGGGPILGTTNGGQSWTAQNSLSYYLYGLSCANTSDCEAGAGNAILGTTSGGQTWTAQSTSASGSGLSCASASVCEAVGGAGKIFGTTNGGQSWSAQTSGTTQALNSVSCPSTTVCEAVGWSGTILGTTNGGQTWTSQSSGTTQVLDGVSCASVSQCEVVGRAGTILAGLASPQNSTAPTITGTAKDGQTLTESHGTWSGSPTSYSYQWEACDSSGNNCTAIAGATGQTHGLSSSEVGDTIRVDEWATNAAGTGGPASSSQTGVVQAIPPSNTAAPSISGTAKDGQMVTATTGSWSGTPPLTYTYQWQDCPAGGGACTSIFGATGQSYKLRSSDVGQQVDVVVTADNSSLPGGAKTSATSSLYPASGVVASLPQVGSLRYFNFSSYPLSDRMSLSVNVASGNVMLVERDLAVAGTGLNLDVSRYYNSEGQPGALLGSAGWTLSVGPDVRLVSESDGSQILYGPSGFEADFSKTARARSTSQRGLTRPCAR